MPPPHLCATIKKIFGKISVGIGNCRILWYQVVNRAKAAELKKSRQLRLDTITRLEQELATNDDPEKAAILRYLQYHHLHTFPYRFRKTYSKKAIAVYTDADMKYVLHANKRLYFPAAWSIGQVQGYYRDLLVEQDRESPHRYESADFQVRDGDIVADVGAAEGIFALSVIDRVQKIYLFECEKLWLAPLQKTFAPYHDKVVIVNRYISDHCENDFTTLDDFFNDHEIDFIKADIEGMETNLLAGAKRILAQREKLRMVLCAYHRENAAQELQAALTENHFATEFSSGYMIVTCDCDYSTQLVRRGVIRARKPAE